MKIKFIVTILLILFLQGIKAQNQKSLGFSIEPSLEKAIYWTKSKDFATPASFGMRMGLFYQRSKPQIKYSIGLNYANRTLKHQQNNIIFGTDIREGTTSSMKSTTQLSEVGVVCLIQRKIKDNTNSKWQPAIGGGFEVNKKINSSNYSRFELANGEIYAIQTPEYSFPSLNLSLIAAQGVGIKLSDKHHLEFDLLERITVLSGIFTIRNIKTNHFSLGFNAKYLFSLNS
jgi:hypothetical protein